MIVVAVRGRRCVTVVVMPMAWRGMSVIIVTIGGRCMAMIIVALRVRGSVTVVVMPMGRSGVPVIIVTMRG